MAIKRRDFLKLSSVTAGTALLAPDLLASPSAGMGAHDDDWGMLNDETICTGCKTCQFVCKKRAGFEPAGDLPMYDNPRDLNAQNHTIVKMYRDDVKHEHSYVKKQCMHCNDPACVSACPVSALTKHPDGPVTYDPSKCIGCRYCMVACPYNVPTFEYESATPQIHKCDLCYDELAQGKPTVCSATCPTGAIITGKRKDLIKEAWRRINANPDKYVHHVYGEHEVGGSAVIYLAGVDFEKIGFPPLQSEALPVLPESIQHGIFKYFVTPLALFGMLAVTRGSTMKCDPVSDEDCIEE